MAADPHTPAADEHTLAVDQVRLGDHAFAHYADDDLRWEVAAVFASQGLARGEKVMIFADPAVPAAKASRHIAEYAGSHEPALASGQLVFTTMQAFVDDFTAERQLWRIREETDRARRAGFEGLRAFIDMAWVRAAGIDNQAVMDREVHADEVFADGRYAEVCSYDRRTFPVAVIDAMRAGHPVALLERPGDLSAFRSADGVLFFVGDADLATGEFFRATLLAARSDAPDRGTVIVNLSRLCFLSAGCASDLLRLAEGPGGCERLIVRCPVPHARTLWRLGAARISRLTLEAQPG
jgi:MEDS: MEthanogen/methylotroph, DcmR Sensory domain